MHYSSIRSHLKPYVIVARRKTTINHAFAAAVAPSDNYDEIRVREAMSNLGQNPDEPLSCAYCGNLAETWDHVFATVRESRFSGHGHRLGNLLPCCKPCNSAKGNKDWRRFLDGLKVPEREMRMERIHSHLTRFGVSDSLPENSPEYQRLLLIREQVLELLAEADQLAKLIRESESAS